MVNENHKQETYTAFLYNGDEAEDLFMCNNVNEAIEFAERHNWDEVVNDITGEVVWKRHTCKDCQHFIGGGDWNLCCTQHHDGYPFGFLCYEDSKACEQYEDKEKNNEVLRNHAR